MCSNKVRKQLFSLPAVYRTRIWDCLPAALPRIVLLKNVSSVFCIYLYPYVPVQVGTGRYLWSTTGTYYDVLYVLLLEVIAIISGGAKGREQPKGRFYCDLYVQYCVTGFTALYPAALYSVLAVLSNRA